MPNQHVVIEEFKDENRPGSTWRLNWFGAVERDPDVATEYKLQVILTLVKEDSLGDWHTEAAVEQDILRMVRVGVGQLPLLRIGSLWKDGTLILLRSGVPRTFALEIAAGIPSFYSATEKVGNSSLVPFRDHRLMGYGKNTKCIVLPHAGDPAGIIIPIIELARFYYASSTRLSKAVFDGDFVHVPSSIYDPEYTGLDDNLAVVCRRQDVSDDDCWTIARILNSQEAFEGSRRINDSMIREFANSGQANPESTFPFSGQTELRALCKGVGYAPERWLVLSIVSCSAPFPYEELQVIADNDPRKADPTTDIPQADKIPISRPSGKQGDDGEPVRLQSGNEPNKEALPKRLELTGECFTALLGKKIQKLRKDHCNYKSGESRSNATPPASTNGTADGNYTNPDVGRADISRLNTDALPPSYELLVTLVEELNKRENVSARLLPLPHGPGLIKARLTAPPGRRQWAYINRFGRQVRHFMILEIVVTSRYFYLLEIERRSTSPSDKYCAEIFFDHYEQPLSLSQIDQLVISLSRNNGRISDPKSLAWCGIQKRDMGLKHTKATPTDYAEKVLHGIATARSMNTNTGRDIDEPTVCF